MILGSWNLTFFGPLSLSKMPFTFIPLEILRYNCLAKFYFLLMLLRLSDSSSNFGYQLRSLIILATLSSLLWLGDLIPWYDLGLKVDESSSVGILAAGFSFYLGFGWIRVLLLVWRTDSLGLIVVLDFTSVRSTEPSYLVIFSSLSADIKFKSLFEDSS